MTLEPENNKNQSIGAEIPNILALQHFNQIDLTHSFAQAVLDQIDSGRKVQNSLIELVCYRLVCANEIESIVQLASILSFILQSDKSDAQYAQQAVKGWSQHSADSSRWKLVNLFSEMDLPFFTKEIFELGAFRAISDTLFLEIEHAGSDYARQMDIAISEDSGFNLIKNILELGRPYEYLMLQALTESFWSLIIDPQRVVDDIAIKTALVINEFGKDVALYIEMRLIESFGDKIDEPNDSVLSGQLCGEVLQALHEGQDLPTYARESVLHQLIEKFNSSSDLKTKIRILTTFGTYAVSDSTQVPIFMTALNSFLKRPLENQTFAVLESLAYIPLPHSEAGIELISSPFITELCKNAASLSVQERTLLGKLLEFCGSAVHRYHQNTTRNLLKNAINFILADDSIYVGEAAYQRIFASLAIDQPEEFCDALRDIITQATNPEAAALCAQIIVDVIKNGVDYLPSNSIKRLIASFESSLHPPLRRSRSIIYRAVEDLSELDNYGVQLDAN